MSQFANMDDSIVLSRQTHQSRHRSSRTAPSSPPHARGQSSHGSAIPPASPEIISSLITSFASISKPSSPDFDSTFSSPIPFSSSNYLSPPRGSFGVEYGSYSRSDAFRPDVSLDELAASPPIIRTFKPPSGFSSLTASKLPARESTSSGGLKSFLSGRSSPRPSSKGSLASWDVDTHSIGNLSIERSPSSSVPELKRRSSHDSWGKMRAHKGLIYMSSKERLKEAEKKRASGGSEWLSASLPRLDPLLGEKSAQDKRASIENGPQSPRAIPARDSSLRKTGANAKRSSRRSSKHRSDIGVNGTIQEIDEQHATRSVDDQAYYEKRRSHQKREDKHYPATDSEDTKKHRSRSSKQRPNSHSHEPQKSHQQQSNEYAIEDDAEDGAPFPAVAQGRRRSGLQVPEVLEMGKAKRNSSKLKRLSGPLSPRPDEKALAAAEAAKKEKAAAEDTYVAYERPDSADSVDDAVEAYLTSPRLSQKIRHPQTGRVISFSEVGDSDGYAVFCCVGMGLTRYIMAFYDELALTLKLRLITPDRPGIGDSEPYADGTATPLSWPDDVYAICQALKITKFSILAHSAGAIYALATALRMPQHIRGRIHLLAPWIPPSQMSVFGSSAQTPQPPANAIPTSQRILRVLPTPILKAANSSFMSATSSSITSSLPKTPRRKRRSNASLPKEREKEAHKHHPMPGDKKENQGHGWGSKDQAGQEDMDREWPHGAPPPDMPNVKSGVMPGIGHLGYSDREAAVIAAAANAIAVRERQAVYDNRLTHAIWSLATTGANPAVDLLVCLERRHTIGFRYVDITRPVIIHHGSRDTRVPVENVRWLGKTMRRCEVRVLEGEEHGLMARASVMGGILMEISKEWEDWGRLTGANTWGRSESTRDERVRRGTVGPAR